MINKRIVLFTANENGGIVQFTIEIARSLQKAGVDYLCFFPDTVNLSRDVSKSIKPYFYKKNKKIYIRNKNNKAIVNAIMSFQPDYFWVTDSSIISTQVLSLVHPLQTILTIHDPKQHSTNRVSIKNKLHDIIYKHYLNNAITASNSILVLSSYSKRVFESEFPKHSNKLYKIDLGAHVVSQIQKCPLEIKESLSDFLLFFGRIDKYKGIGNFLSSFKSVEKKLNVKFVIAGSGTLSESEKTLIKQSKNTFLINRYISDDEMNYLFSHSCCLVLPYLDATQSGIIPIAYMFGKPVIVSNVDGLTQFVDNGKTGFICHNDIEYIKAITDVINPSNTSVFKSATEDYYKKYLNLDSNIVSFLNNLSSNEK